MTIRSRLLANRSHVRPVLLGVALATALVPAVAAAAQADTSAPDISATSTASLPSCGTSTLCTFQNSGYGGTRWDFAYSSWPHGTWFWIGSAANDQISSFYNHRAWTSYFAKNCPADNNWGYSPGGGYNPNLNNGQVWQDGSKVNDSISAIGLGTSTSTTDYPAHGSC